MHEVNDDHPRTPWAVMVPVLALAVWVAGMGFLMVPF